MRTLSPSFVSGTLLVMCCYATALNAQQDLFELSFNELLDIEVTSASKFAQSIRLSPSTVSHIDKQQIDDYGWYSINDVLYYQPGFGPGQDFDRPTTPTRGFGDSWSNNHILHLIDGIPMNGNLYGSAFTWDITPLTFTESMEIIRGPGSALYGSKATNGVVQINSYDAEQLNQQTRLKLLLGQDKEQRLSVLKHHKFSAVDLIWSYDYQHSDGHSYPSLDGSGRTSGAELQQFEVNNQLSSHNLFTKLSFAQLPELDIYFQHQSWEFETGHGWLWWVPDQDEGMQQQRHIIAAKWQQDIASNQLELMFRYQRQQVDWSQRYYPDNAFAGFYPNGLWEQLKSNADDVLLRAQWLQGFDQQANLILGYEAQLFYYDDDEQHWSNVDLDTPPFAPFANNQRQDLGPWLDYIKNQLLPNHALYAHWHSGETLGDKLSLSLGARWDHLKFDYRQINQQPLTKASRSFINLSPRASLVYSPNKALSLKLSYSEAFRMPQPTELAGAHTFSLASDIANLEPELLKNIELAADYQLSDSSVIRLNLFEARFNNQIAFSVSNNNLSTNVYSQKNRGLELEYSYQWQQWSAFANYAHVSRVDEHIRDNFIALADSTLTNEPANKINLGLNRRADNWQWSLSAHYQGEVQRRSSELGLQTLPGGVGVELNLDLYRPRELSSWIRVDTQFSYQLTAAATLSLKIENLLDKEIYLAKSGAYPFDYQQNDRHLLLALSYELDPFN